MQTRSFIPSRVAEPPRFTLLEIRRLGELILVFYAW